MLETEIMDWSDLNTILYLFATQLVNPKVKLEVKQKAILDYKAGSRFQLANNEWVEVVVDAECSDIYYDRKEHKIFILLKVRYDSHEYQNINLTLLKHGTCARDKYNQFPGMQHYTQAENIIIQKIPNIAKKAYDIIKLTLDNSIFE